ncbi:MAG: GGDEF domain-containing protein [Candidatus Omnitrophica bacterium]|nr:GGDEF domain-containing protein [Candidatus Omnitrophota bacterium]
MKKWLDTVIPWCEKQSAARILLLGCALVVLLGTLDFLSGPIQFLIFYLLPVFFVTWFTGIRAGIAVSVVSAVVWLVDERLASADPAHFITPYLNLAVSLGFFLFVVFIVDRVKSLIVREREIANTDHLTGAATSRHFSDILEREIDRSRRYGHVVTLAYIDIDDFKQVNDRFGHSAGDALLSGIAGKIRAQIRTVDVLARLGGDEFAILFPETGAQGARIVIDRIRQSIDRTAHGRDWPIAISVGVVTCPKVPVSMDKLLMLADETMYMSKQAGKDRATYRVYAT